jgi:hypothetical protein
MDSKRSSAVRTLAARVALPTLSLLCCGGSVAGAQARFVQVIGESRGGFGGVLDDFDEFGASVTALGDLDGDGIADMAVGAPQTHHQRMGPGVVWILFLNGDGTVRAQVRIASGESGFSGDVQPSDGFGASVTVVGDLDGDGVVDLAVGAPGDDDGGHEKGAIWILFLRSDGTVHWYQKLSQTSGGFSGFIPDFAQFGRSAAGLGDLDGDGVPDLAVGMPRADSRSYGFGGVLVLFLQPDGTVRTHSSISRVSSSADVGDGFGTSVMSPGDVDGDGVVDLVVGAPYAIDSCFSRFTGCDRFAVGDAFTVFLRGDGTLRSSRSLGYRDTAEEGGLFAVSAAAVGDVNGDGVPDVAVGNPVPGLERGLVRTIHLSQNGASLFDAVVSGLDLGLDPPGIGESLAVIGDLDGDGRDELALGLPHDSATGNRRGAVAVVFPDTDCSRSSVNSGVGPPVDVLRVNGQVREAVSYGDIIVFSLNAAPAGPHPARYVVWAWEGRLSESYAVTVRGSSIGCTVGATPLGALEGPAPILCARSLAIPGALCGSARELRAAPSAPWQKGVGSLRQGRVLTFQGIIEDVGASNPLGASLTNAVRLTSL